jgi:hypothetical protein
MRYPPGYWAGFFLGSEESQKEEETEKLLNNQRRSVVSLTIVLG